ncbi:MAG: OmpA family protein [Polyangiaceae bacterium]
MRAIARLVPVVIAAIVVASASPASAQETANPVQGRGFAVDRFVPSERGSDWFTNESLDLRGHGRPAVGLVSNFAFRPLVILAPDGTIHRSIVRELEIVNLGGTVTVWDRLRVGLDLPIQLHAFGTGGVVRGVSYEAPKRSTSLGDLRLGADVRVHGTAGDPFTIAAGLRILFPTGDVASYASDGSVRVAPRLAVAGDVGGFTYAARVGLDVRGRSELVADSAIGTSLTFGAAAGLRALDSALVLGPELSGSALVGGPSVSSASTTPIEALFGFHYALRNVRFGVGAGAGLNQGLGNPVARILANVEWMPFLARGDTARPSEPSLPEVSHLCADGTRARGTECPDGRPRDEDHDGIADAYDACRSVPGVVDDDPMRNGCPRDADADGIPDDADACVRVRGVPDPDPSKNGCPADADGDGIADDSDACPSVRGVASQDRTANGCPDPDRDHDGIPNDVDACPDDAGAPDLDPKKRGCPAVSLKDDRVLVLEPVKFRGTTLLVVESQRTLDGLLKLLSEKPEIKLLRIEGHTDDRGDARANRRLGEARAGTVVKWLVVHGIDPARLAAVGVGPDRPMDSNDTEAGRQNNRRLEFHVDH